MLNGFLIHYLRQQMHLGFTLQPHLVQHMYSRVERVALGSRVSVMAATTSPHTAKVGIYSPHTKTGRWSKGLLKNQHERFNRQLSCGLTAQGLTARKLAVGHAFGPTANQHAVQPHRPVEPLKERGSTDYQRELRAKIHRFWFS